MKTKLAVLLLAATFSATAQASTRILPDACGSDATKFEVQLQKDKPALLPPEEGKAQIVFIAENVGNTISRFGMDGSWAGANKGSSYFVIFVAPGEHHFCITNVKTLMWPDAFMSTTSVTTEAGKVYYIKFKVNLGAEHSFLDTFSLVTEDDGKYSIKAFPLSISTPKK